MFETLGIRIVMVLDGPQKPPLKRNILHDWSDDVVWVNYLIDTCSYRNIQVVRAPGEGEAECSRLQIEGDVDWVFSNDSDCLLFGATKVVMFVDDSSSSSRQVQCLEIDHSKFSRGSFILMGLLVGGDYDVSGVCRFGSKFVMRLVNDTEFGTEFGQLLHIDNKITSTPQSTEPPAGILDDWRERLNHEVATNESKLFARKNPSKQIPADFPNPRVLNYYVNPLVNRGVDKFHEGMIDVLLLNSYFNANFPYSQGYESYREFCNLFASTTLVRRIFADREVAGSFQVVREIKGANEGMVRLEYDLDKLMEIGEPEPRPSGEKGPVTQRDLWRFVIEQSNLGQLELRKYQEQQQQRELSQISSVSSPSKSRKAQVPPPSKSNRSINDFFVTKKPSLNRKAPTGNGTEPQTPSTTARATKPSGAAAKTPSINGRVTKRTRTKTKATTSDTVLTTFFQKSYKQPPLQQHKLVGSSKAIEEGNETDDDDDDDDDNDSNNDNDNDKHDKNTKNDGFEVYHINHSGPATPSTSTST